MTLPRLLQALILASVLATCAPLPPATQADVPRETTPRRPAEILWHFDTGG